MTVDPAHPVPSGVRAIAALFALCGIYLGVAGGVMLIRPGAISMSAGAPLLFGLELAGPYMFLLTAIVAGGVAWGLVQLNNIVRHGRAHRHRRNRNARAARLSCNRDGAAETARARRARNYCARNGGVVSVAKRSRRPLQTNRVAAGASVRPFGTVALSGRARPTVRTQTRTYFLGRADSFSPTRWLTLNVILPVFLSASTTTWSPCSTSPSRIFIASGSCTSF